MVASEHGGAVELLLAECEELIGTLSNELLAMRHARVLLEDSSLKSVQLLEGMGVFLGNLAKLTDVVGAVAQELESRSLAALVAGIENRVTENSALVQDAVSVGNENLLSEFRELRGELAAVKVLASQAAGKKGLIF